MTENPSEVCNRKKVSSLQNVMSDEVPRSNSLGANDEFFSLNVTVHNENTQDQRLIWLCENRLILGPER